MYYKYYISIVFSRFVKRCSFGGGRCCDVGGVGRATLLLINSKDFGGALGDHYVSQSGLIAGV